MLMRRLGFMIGGSLCVVVGAVVLVRAADPNLPVAANLDLKRYQGKWYELARLPNRFERGCVSDVIATYSLQADGKIAVENSCKESGGKMMVTRGTARLASKDGPASKLKVTFFWPFSGDYWVVDVDPEYRRALVGAPNREYLWVLSRTPEMADDEYEHLLGRAKKLGFAVERVERTRQN